MTEQTATSDEDATLDGSSASSVSRNDISRAVDIISAAQHTSGTSAYMVMVETAQVMRMTVTQFAGFVVRGRT